MGLAWFIVLSYREKTPCLVGSFAVVCWIGTESYGTTWRKFRAGLPECLEISLLAGSNGMQFRYLCLDMVYTIGYLCLDTVCTIGYLCPDTVCTIGYLPHCGCCSWKLRLKALSQEDRSVSS